jgi:hypothetical protein
MSGCFAMPNTVKSVSRWPIFMAIKAFMFYLYRTVRAACAAGSPEIDGG